MDRSRGYDHGVLRHPLATSGLRLSLLEWPAPAGAPTLLCLHGHFGRAAQYGFLAAALPGWRVAALEQRGHGLSDHAASYGRGDYLADALAACAALGDRPLAVLGSSLGGVNAYQLAARRPELVRALIVEDIGAACRDDLSWCLRWPRRWPTLRAAARDLHPYFLENLVEDADGWGLRCDLPGIVASGRALDGDWWTDWLASACPALLLRGGASPVLSAAHAAEMAARRPRTTLVEFAGCGHNLNEAEPERYAAEVGAFLARLGP